MPDKCKVGPFLKDDISTLYSILTYMHMYLPLLIKRSLLAGNSHTAWESSLFPSPLIWSFGHWKSFLSQLTVCLEPNFKHFRINNHPFDFSVYVKDIFLLYLELWASKRYIPSLFWVTINIFVKPASWKITQLPIFLTFLCQSSKISCVFSFSLKLSPSFFSCWPSTWFSQPFPRTTSTWLNNAFNWCSIWNKKSTCLSKNKYKSQYEMKVSKFFQHNLSVGKWLTCLHQTILPDWVGKSRTWLILHAVLWLYWTYKELIYPSCKRCLNVSKLLSAQLINCLLIIILENMKRPYI